MSPLPRLSGVLLPVFSLKSTDDFGIGDFAALEPLLDWLQLAAQKMLMVLPLLPTAPGDASPYATRSAFGMNPLFIHLPWLPEGVSLTEVERERVHAAKDSPVIRYDVVLPLKTVALERAFAIFESQGTTARSRELDSWCMEQRTWLDGYALFCALSERFAPRPWWEWPSAFAMRDASALNDARRELQRRLRFHHWLQWTCAGQWKRVRLAAQSRGVLLCGDEPFIIGGDSADCWQYPHLLRRDARLGVPPDDFSAEGQDWGLPWFDFDALASEQHGWLKRRAQHASATFDVRRVDHAIGYFRQYVRDQTSPLGRFVPNERSAQQALGARNFALLKKDAHLFAEDLGVIPRFVKDALARLGLPGYQVMRWAREEGIYRNPHHYPEESLVTTGTHDTSTVRAWWGETEAWERERVCQTWPELQGFQSAPTPWSLELHEALLRAALQAQSRYCILPWQDVFGEVQRINTPGTVGPHNWSYRMQYNVQQLRTDVACQRTAHWLARLTREGQRA